MKKYLAYYENEWPANIAELTAIENKPFVGVCGKEVLFTVIPLPVTGPADNEIWYTTYNNTIINKDFTTYDHVILEITSIFGSDILEHTYSNKGVIKCEKPITRVVGNSTADCSVFPFGGTTSIVFPDSCTTLDHSALWGLNDLEKIVLPRNLQTVGHNIMWGCYILKDNFINNSSLDAEANNYWGATIIDEQTSDGLLIKDNCIQGVRSWASSITIPQYITGGFARVFSMGEAEPLEGGITSIKYEGTLDLWNNYMLDVPTYKEYPRIPILCTDGVGYFPEYQEPEEL